MKKKPLPPHLQKWKKIREKGLGRFVLLRGVLGFGIPVGILMTVMNARQNGFSPRSLGGSALICVLGGLFYGWYIWYSSERRYRRYLAAEN
jgi:hypothetical protein